MPIRRLPACLVETARALPDSDDGWQLAAGIEPDEAEECLGSLDGWARLIERSGEQLPAGYPEVVEIPDSTLAPGSLVRILVEDPAGTIERSWLDGSVRSYLAAWHGVVRERQRRLDPARSRPCTWQCEDLLGILARLPVLTSIEQTTTTAGATERQITDLVPLANATPGGNRSASPVTLAANFGGRSCHIFDRRSGASPERWTVQDLVEYLLVLASFPWPYGLDDPIPALDWRLGTGAALLAFDAGPQELEGNDVRTLLRSLVSPARGLCFVPRVAGSIVYLDILSVTPETVTVGSYTLPARTGTALDASSSAEGAAFLEGPDLVDDSSAADLIRVSTQRPPLCALTLFYTPGSTTCSLQPGWDTTGDPQPPDQGDDDPALEYLWRLWTIRPTWDGRTWNQTTGGLRQPSQSDYDGDARAWVSTMPPREALRLERLTPYGLGGASSGDQQPAFALIGSVAAGWQSLARMPITILDDGTGLLLGSGPEDARFLASMLASGSGLTLLITVGLREWTRSMVAWTRPIADWPGAIPRILDRQIDGEEWFAYQGTVTGLNSSTSAVTTEGSDRSIQSVTDRLQQTLALLVARHGTSGATAAWRERGLIDCGSTYAPGAWLPSITTETGSETVSAVVSRRHWTFRRSGHGTSYSTERPALDPAAFRR